MTVSKTPEYQAWQQMKARCRNPRNCNYRNYGARGIKVCGGFDAFINFHLAVGDRPTAQHSVDRKDNEGNYSCGKCPECRNNDWPLNVRWATCREQSSNQRKTVNVTHNNQTMCVSEWARRAGLSSAVLWRRLFVSKWPMDKALKTPATTNAETNRRDQVRITINGQSYRAKEWARISGIPYSTVYYYAKRQSTL